MPIHSSRTHGRPAHDNHVVSRPRCRVSPMRSAAGMTLRPSTGTFSAPRTGVDSRDLPQLKPPCSPAEIDRLRSAGIPAPIPRSVRAADDPTPPRPLSGRSAVTNDRLYDASCPSAVAACSAARCASNRSAGIACRYREQSAGPCTPCTGRGCGLPSGHGEQGGAQDLHIPSDPSRAWWETPKPEADR
jgi:hypothetical protein